MTPNKKEPELLPGESCSKLQISAKRGVLSAHQTDDQVRTTWTCQEETCPICREHIPWHRGVVYQNGHQLIWVCMVCSILEIGAMKKQTPRAIGNLSIERVVPLPSGYTLAWLNTLWITSSDVPVNRSAIDVAKLIGYEATSLIWAAILEDRTAARLTRPEDFDDPKSPWRPFLLEDPFPKTTLSEHLLGYVCTKEETATTNFVHTEVGFQDPICRQVEITNAGGDTGNVPLLVDDRLKRLPGMSSEDRGRFVPRIGLASRESWEDTHSNIVFGIHELALWTPCDQQHILYMIPFRNCGEFYFQEKGRSWMNSPNEYYSQVGFDFGQGIDKRSLTERTLWESVFGDALVPDEFDSGSAAR